MIRFYCRTKQLLPLIGLLLIPFGKIWMTGGICCVSPFRIKAAFPNRKLKCHNFLFFYFSNDSAYNKLFLKEQGILGGIAEQILAVV